MVISLSSCLFVYLLKGGSSRWAAQRIRAEDEGKFDAVRAAKEGRPVFFTGEVGIGSGLFSMPKSHNVHIQLYEFIGQIIDDLFIYYIQYISHG